MKVTTCEDCQHFEHEEEYCQRHKRPIAKINGCSWSKTAKKLVNEFTFKEAKLRSRINKEMEGKLGGKV